jgi:cell fate regulator YaaT (PSP1 superfamily)
VNKVFGVIFNGNDKKFYYKSENDYEIDSLVIVETERGQQLVKVVQVLDDYKDEITDEIIRLATTEDYEKYLENLKDADKALKKCITFAKELELDMNIVNAQFNLDRSQLLFNFIADGRIDFRELAKKLASIYHTRIELRQIGARDKAKEVGGIGVCGGELCCLRFLKKIDAISMNMAKNQNLALNPSKINGACGRLLCCLAYEDEAYIEAAKKMPKIGDKIDTPAGEAQVVSVDIINQRGKVMINGEKVDYDFKSEE